MLEFFNSYTRLKNSVRNVYIRLRTRMSLSKANRCELTNLTIARMMMDPESLVELVEVLQDIQRWRLALEQT